MRADEVQSKRLLVKFRKKIDKSLARVAAQEPSGPGSTLVQKQPYAEIFRRQLTQGKWFCSVHS